MQVPAAGGFFLCLAAAGAASLLLLLRQLSTASAQSRLALGCDLTGNLSKGKVTPIVEEN